MANDLNVIENIQPLKMSAEDIDNNFNQSKKTVIECNLLCDIDFQYPKGKISYVIDEMNQYEYKFVRHNTENNNDVIFNDTPYTLKYFYIGDKRHKSYINTNFKTNDFNIVGEITLFHKGINDNLIVSIPISKKRYVNSSSSSFFNRLLSVSVGINLDNKIKTVEINDEFDMKDVLPADKSYYIYSDNTNNIRTLLFKNPINIESDNWKKALNHQYTGILEEREKLNTEYIYTQDHNTRQLLEAAENSVTNSTNNNYKCKPSNLFSVNYTNIDPHAPCELRDKDIYNDFPKEWIGIEGKESQLEIFFVSVFLVCITIIFFFDTLIL